MLRTVLAAILLVATPAAAETFMGYECKGDCSGHVAGHDWASDEEITELQQCYGAKSRSFAEGCMAYLDDETGDDGVSDALALIEAQTKFKESVLAGGGDALYEKSVNCWLATQIVDQPDEQQTFMSFTERCFYADFWAPPVVGSADGYFSEKTAVFRANAFLTKMGIGKGMRMAILASWIRQAKKSRPLE